MDVLGLLQARIKAHERDIIPIEALVDITSWISRSNFLRFQQPEPIVGGPVATYPAMVEEFGIKGQSVYTALFTNIDMVNFPCQLCSHTVDDLEDAITHQRIDHFGHYPYQCPATNPQWYACFAPSL